MQQQEHISWNVRLPTIEIHLATIAKLDSERPERV